MVRKACNIEPGQERGYRVYTMTAHATTMKSVGVREFRNHASTYLSGTEPIAVNRHGKVIGFYIPVERDDDEVERAVALLPATLEKVIERTSSP